MGKVDRLSRVAWLVPLAATATPAAGQSRLDAPKAAAAFGALDQILDVSISPAGDKLAIVVPGPKQSTTVLVSDLKTGASSRVNSADGNPMTVTGCNWAFEDRIVCRLYGVSNINYDRYIGYSRLIAMDADGRNPLRLGAYQRQQEYASTSDGYVIDWRDGASASVLIARRYVPGKASGLDSATSLAEGLGADLIDTRTGRTTRVESPERNVSSYVSDGQGAIRLMAVNLANADGQLRGS